MFEQGSLNSPGRRPWLENSDTPPPHQKELIAKNKIDPEPIQGETNTTNTTLVQVIAVKNISPETTPPQNTHLCGSCAAF